MVIQEFSAGSYLPQVYIADEGYISVNETLSPTVIEVEFFTCLPATGSRAGGLEITISGEHLGYDLDEETTTLTMDGKPMKIVSLGQSEIKVVTPNTVVDGEMATSEIVVTVNDKTFSSSDCFAFMDEADQPTISSYEPASVNPNLKTQFTITGVNFDTVKETRVELIRETDQLPCECFVISVTSTEVVCAIPGGYGGTYDVYVY